MADNKNASAIIDFAADLAKTLARNPEVPVSGADVPAVKDAVIQAANGNTILSNALNMEDLYKSRIMVGLAIAAIGTIIVPFGFKLTPEQVEQWTSAGTAAITLGGIAYAGYGRIKGAKLKPLTWFGFAKG